MLCVVGLSGSFHRAFPDVLLIGYEFTNTVVMTELNSSLNRLALEVVAALRDQKRRLVLAESCTGGLLASTLAQISGVSEVFCGSAVTYRNETKAEWIDVSREILANPTIGPVSSIVADQMCRGVLDHTSEADLAASITGHLGPNAPPELDGVIYIGVWSRGSPAPEIEKRMVSAIPPDGVLLREYRRVEAARFVLQRVLNELLHSNRSEESPESL